MAIRINDTFEHYFVVNTVVYSGFINLFKDTNPLHTDEEFAINHGFKSCVMHGNILNGFISYFIGECLPNKNVIIHSQEIQFKKPVYLNTVLQFNLKVTDIIDSVNTIRFVFSFKNEEFEIVSKGKIQIGLL